MKKLKILFVIIAFLSSGIIASAEDNDTYISEEIQGYCTEVAEIYDVSPELLMAMIESESSGRPNVSNGSCKGLMQVSERWHKDRMERLGVTDLYEPYGNILVGTDYIVELTERYEDIGIALMYYNGDSRAKKVLEGEAELSKYAKTILARTEELKKIHEKREENMIKEYGETMDIGKEMQRIYDKGYNDAIDDFTKAILKRAIYESTDAYFPDGLYGEVIEIDELKKIVCEIAEQLRGGAE